MNGHSAVNAFRVILLAALVLALSACATMPAALRGDFTGVQPATATATSTGKPVRWGGRLLAVHPKASQTCFEILSLPLDDTAEPQRSGQPGHRFLACRAGFVDPAAFPVDRLVTIVGKLDHFETRTIGSYHYRYPVVALGTVHLWPKPVEARPYPAPPWFYDPWFYDPWYPRLRDPWGRPYGW